MLLIFSWIMTWILCNTCNVCNLVINYKWPNCVNRWRSPNLQKKLPMSSDTRKDLVIFKVYTIFPWRFVKIPYNRNNSYEWWWKWNRKWWRPFFARAIKILLNLNVQIALTKFVKRVKKFIWQCFSKIIFIAPL